MNINYTCKLKFPAPLQILINLTNNRTFQLIGLFDFKQILNNVDVKVKR